MEFSDFQRLARDSAIVSVTREIHADLLTPALVYLALESDSTRSAFLFESVEGGKTVGRYSIIGADPVAELRLTEDGGTLREGRRVTRFEVHQSFDMIRRLLPDGRVNNGSTHELPFRGGWVGFFSYDCARLFEHLPKETRDPLQNPWIMLGLYDRVVVFDHARQTACVSVTARIDSDSRTTRKKLYDSAQRRTEQLIRVLNRPLAPPALSEPRAQSATSNMKCREFVDGVKRVKRHIARGDIFQGVLSQRFSVRASPRPFDVYRRLRRTNPSPYMYYLRCGELAIAGSSPETLVQKRGSLITTRPIAGTRPRGKTESEDARFALQLKNSPKENAEHVMLVDLGRNDLGRVSRPGTVSTVQFRSIDHYSHVMHMVSTVTGRARRRTDALDVLAAAFPAGTVTGAPKIRAMEIIESIEPDRRGIYAGCVGYVDWQGDMDVAIAIRTAVMDKWGAHVQAGAGIVADSDPMREYRETQNKAAAPLSAVGGQWSKGDAP